MNFTYSTPPRSTRSFLVELENSQPNEKILSLTSTDLIEYEDLKNIKTLSSPTSITQLSAPSSPSFRLMLPKFQIGTLKFKFN